MRIKATISAALEYDIPSGSYLGASTKEMLEAEKDLLTADPEAFQHIDWKVQVEEVKGDKP